MQDVLVARVMSTDPVTVTPDTFVEPAAELMLDQGIGSLLVVDEDGALRGILTTTDFVAIVAASKPKAETTVERYMSTDVVTAGAQDSVQEVANLMTEHGFHHVPVVDEEEGLIGMVSTTDIAKYVAGLDPAAADVV
ncbi:CBS domain-containing protein [Haloparvum sedimenti]|uniref:CBS domain-containing protein n=1 Tax=Haloparvum sedimenti TaxID=1678448 RepID=UPI00071E7D9E|nr:CBS domain-containing protein [Haloparvum sedimenti]